MKEIFNNEIKFIYGENAQDNWNLLDYAKKENEKYIWFHLNSFPSPYVIMFSDNNDQNNLLFGANLCKDKSKYKNFKNLKIMILPLNKISKTEKIGEVTTIGKSKIIKI
jgi:predicted ribosome quality control (RQC) complex YloA/Tae2 family protein